jgi:outer membrane murein-binding lipoprotein Lpp
MDRRAPSPVGRPALAASLGALALVAGCAQPGPLMSRTTTIGSLKANVAQLEAEKDALRRQVAEQESDNRKLQDQLVASKSAYDELSNRLADAQDQLRRQGGGLAGSSRSADFESEPLAPRTAPARNSRRGRKSPLTQIPGSIDIPAPGDAGEAEPAPPPRDDPEPQAMREDHDTWLPVARGVSAPTSTIR